MTPAEHDRLGDAPPAFGPGGGNGEWGNKRRQQLEEAAKQAGPRPQADEDRKNLNYLREREDRLVDGRGDGKGGQPGQGQKPFVGAAMHDLNRDQQHKGVDPARQEAKGEGGGGGKADPRPGYRAPGLPMPVPPGAAPAPENLAKLAGATAPAMPPGKAGEAGRAVAKDMEQAQRNGRFGGGLNRFKQQPGDLKAADAGLAQAPRGNMPTNGLPPLQEQNLDAVIQNLRAPQYGQNELQARALQNVDALKKLKEAQEKKEVAELDKADKASMAEKSLVRLRQQMEQQQRVLAQPCFVRQYAHERQFGPDPDIRADFTETIYWHPALVLADGKADLGFELPDSVTSFQLVAFGHTADGRLGAFTSEFESKKPFNLNAAVPLEVTANDLIDVPVAVDNNTPDARVIRLTVETHGLTVLPGTENSKTVSLQMKPGERGRTIFRMQPSIKEGTAVVKIKGVTEPFGADAVRYTINVVPEGFPVSSQLSDVLEGVAQHELMLPKDGLIPGTLKANLQVFPSRLADLQGGLEGLLREPRGCFEQTSTSNYPNVMIMGYMRETNQGSQQLFDDAAGKLERGYAKLVSFECMNRGKNQREGYEWFGGTAPAHEALTAYGLLQFRDMKRIGFPVDEAMVARTRKYLLDQRDGEGGFKRNTRALDSFGRAPQEITNAYIVWALTEADLDGNKEDLTKELDALKKLAQDDNQRWSKDPYFLSLVANSFLNRDKSDAFGAELLKKLVTLQKKEGFVDGAQTSITTSGGRTLQIETTGLAVLAWLKYNQPHEFREPLDKAIKWIGQQRGGHGAFGSTQSTILALKALLAYTRENNKPMKAGKLTLKVNGKTVAERDFDANAKEALVIDLPEAEKVFALGKNDVQISLAGGAVLPYTLSWNYSALTPANQEKPAITMSANLSRLSAKDGETVGMTVAVANTQNKGQGMVVAIVGLPAGLELPANLEQLRNYARLQKNDKGEEVNGKISAFEVRGRELVLYWRQMTPNEKIELPIDLICRVPGEYRGPASRSYLYYNADHKYWVDPLKVAVAPKAD
ncbi:MAG: hypothetical protein JNM56_30895 [Planctomycetia bacterium]|nr:hypothetical protein [Planctomycetia bacterium]